MTRLCQNLWISKDFQAFSEISDNLDFYSKNKSCQIGSKMFLGHPGHAYSPGNDTQTLWKLTEIRDLVPVYGRHVNFLLAEEHDFVELDLSLYWELGGERQQK